MSFFDELNDITTEAISMFGKDENGAQITLIYEGVTIPGYEEDGGSEEALQAGGVVPDMDLIVRAKLADFPTRPKGIRPITFAGKPGRILKVFGSTGDPEIRLAISAPNYRGK